MLEGLKVIDAGSLVSGPYCAKLLGDLGAEVIKIEPPGKGDEARARGPFPNDVPHPERSGLFLYVNAGKLGITLDLRCDTGRRLFQDLVRQSDVLIENFLPPVRDELGLGFDTLRKLNARLVVTSITPFGSEGPYKDYLAPELVVFQMSGVGYGTPGEVAPEDLRKEPPLRARILGSQFMSGMGGAAASLAALLDRERTGLGQQVDVAQQEVLAAMMWVNLAQLFHAGKNPTREKQGRYPAAPMHILPCRDGYVHLECLEEHQWTAFVSLIGSPEWSKNELFRTRESRAEYWDALGPLVTEVTTTWGKEDLSKAAQARGIPCTVVRRADDLLSSRQLAEREFFTRIEHPVAGPFVYPGLPFKVPGPPRETHPAPLLGQHNEVVLCGRLGCDRSDLARLRAVGAI